MPHSQAYTTLVRVTYGISVYSDDDVLVSLFGETQNRIVDEGTPGASMIDLFPLREFWVRASYTLQSNEF